MRILSLTFLLLASFFLRADEFFIDKVEPILKDNCYKCHSHDAGKMKGGLTLDSRAGWATGGDSGPAIAPGKPEESLLIKAIRYEDSDYEMPPKKPLAKEEVEILVEWVKRGAPDPRKGKSSLADTNWWSLKKLSAFQAPPGDHPIDAFIRRRLSKEGLKPSPPASRETLAQRLYLDLHGYHPTPEEVTAFADNTKPRAYLQLVSQLLASPRYGERWARHWLDTIHFADTHGCEHDVKRPNAWRFRDYVIQRLNDDIPWDRFIREQLAPDVFFPEKPQLTAGLGFIAAGPLELSRAETARKTFDYLDRDDIVTQTMSVFVSTTANCARCHNHKFDPVTQEDYFALQAVFAGVGKGEIEFDVSAEAKARRNEMNQLISAANTKNKEILLQNKYSHLIDTWITNHQKKPLEWKPLDPEVFIASGQTKFTKQQDRSLFAEGPATGPETYTITAPVDLKKITGLRIDVLKDERLPKGGPGRAGNGNLHLAEVDIQWFPQNTESASPVKIARASADFDQDGWTSAHAIDNDPKTAWAIYPKVNESHHIVFEFTKSIETSAGGKLAITLKHLPPVHLIGRFKLSVTEAEGAEARAFPSEVSNGLAKSTDQRTENESLALAAIALKDHAEQTLASLPAKHAVYGVSNFWSHAKKGKPYSPKPVHLLRRGDITKPQHEVRPGAFSALSHLPARFELSNRDHEPARRAALADWLAHQDNPLTWRSIVNRVWHYHFGQGLSNTPNDFGRMGSQPSHPELLDWLAAWFRDEAKGSLKELHKLILTSQTWQQSSTGTQHDRDPTNRLLSRMNRQHLDADVIRDSLLRLSGKIDLTMGGPGIEQFTKTKGHQGSSVLDYEAFDWNSPHAPRRTIYRVVWRGIPDPFMEALDFPDLGILAPKRTDSISALQSLALFNNNFVLHSSDWLADRVSNEHPDLDSQITRLVHLLWLRQPNPDELQQFKAYAQQHSLPALSRILINSNEFLFIE